MNKQVFVGGVQVGGAGTIPFGKTSPIEPPGSCPAQPDGPIPDGQQLVDITQVPNAPVPASGGNAAPAPDASSPSPSPSPATNGPSDASPSPAAPADNGSPVTPAAGKAADGRAAQQQNAKFATLTPDSQCDGETDFHLQPDS